MCINACIFYILFGLIHLVSQYNINYSNTFVELKKLFESQIYIIKAIEKNQPIRTCKIYFYRLKLKAKYHLNVLIGFSFTTANQMVSFQVVYNGFAE